ncbi:single-stranded DNA-binding protein [Halalkalibacter krulwichiae]|uniref:Single-stranded DNA-binding protein n=1 Tax=Halalkalibacter krulwichiae TaxID=199441 RepID=A0A1X9MFC9_9BACI|nr:single-stranded DNA-binding protein [Halalkalibacter krulwichiae]ARK32148.1 Single-stranded DNA-binding protein ssb [Halalkalibacter krulwichiae]
MLNRVVLVGRLTKDPELRYTPNGVAVANFTLAVNRMFSNESGERDADFINCVIWRKQAENVANYLKKGSLAGVDGRIQTRSYDNSEGKRVFITEVVAESVQFLEPRGTSSGQNVNRYTNTPAGYQNANTGQQGAYNDPFANDGKPIDISDNDLPF